MSTSVPSSLRIRAATRTACSPETQYAQYRNAIRAMTDLLKLEGFFRDVKSLLLDGRLFKFPASFAQINLARFVSRLNDQAFAARAQDCVNVDLTRASANR